MKISLADNLAAAALGKMPMPKLKGKAIFTLTDVKTGSRERIVSENMVTDAVAELFAMNYLGMANFNAEMALYNCMSGCFLFANTLTEDVGTIWPPNSTTNNLVARCGQTPHSDPTDTRRGNPVAPEISGDHVTFKFDWNREQGNGTINCVCLTHPLAADYGLQPNGSGSLLKNYSNVVDNINAFRNNALGDDALTRDRTKALPVAFDADGNGISLYCTTTALEEITVSHSFYNVKLLENGVMSPMSNYRELSTRSATLSRTFDLTYTLIAQDSANYYVMERDSGNNTKLYVDVVSKSDMSVTGKTLTISGYTLERTQPGRGGAGIYGGIVSDGSVYWVSGSDAKTFIRIDINDPADVEELTSTLTDNIVYGQQAVVISDGLILGHNFLINGQRVFPVAVRAVRYGTDMREYPENGFITMASGNGGPGYFGAGYGANNLNYQYSTQGGFIVLPFLATVNNLPAPGVTKSNSKTMRLEYVLTQI